MHAVTADASSSSLVPIVVGLLIGGAISAIVTWRALDPRRVQRDSDVATGQDPAVVRAQAMKRVAAIYAPISFLCLAVAVVDGGTTFIVLAGINAFIGVVAIVLARRLAGTAQDLDSS